LQHKKEQKIQQNKKNTFTFNWRWHVAMCGV